jgi:hypothetical protein
MMAWKATMMSRIGDANSFPGKVLKSQSGSFAVIMALSLMFLVSVLAFVLDLGYFVKEKGRYQACADAAALAAADNLCYGKAEEMAQRVAFDRDTLLPDDFLEVEYGFYDAYDEYNDDFSEYKNFAPESSGEFPGTESNAVMVTIGSLKVDSLTGLNKSKEIKAAAVAYLPRIGMVAKKKITVMGGLKISFHDVNIHAGDKIILRDPDVSDNVKIASKKNKIYTYKHYYNSSGWSSYNSKTKRASDDLPEAPLIEKYLITLDDYAKKLKQRADRVYLMADKGTDAFYAVDYSQNGNIHCFFDFTKSHNDNQIIFIDIPRTINGKKVTAYLTPFPCADGKHNLPGFPCVICNPSDPLSKCDTRKAFGDSMKNMTIVALCNVEIPIYRNVKSKDFQMGGIGFDQLSIVSGGDIKFCSGFNSMSGINFFCDSFRIEFAQDKGFTPPKENHLRVVTEDGNITFGKNDSNVSKQYDFNFKFGPPCPLIVPPALGLLD